MNLKRLAISIETDGFRIIDKGSGIAIDTLLLIRYHAGNEWFTKEVTFEREPWSLFHPFRKSMFVYTGAKPSRVLISLAEAPMQKREGTIHRRIFFEQNNFSSSPAFHDSVWDDDSYFSFFYYPEVPEDRPQTSLGNEAGITPESNQSEESAVRDAAPVSTSAPEPSAAEEPAVEEHQPSKIETPEEEPSLSPVEKLDLEIPSIDTSGEITTSSTEEKPSETTSAAVANDTPAVSGQATDGDREPNAY